MPSPNFRRRAVAPPDVREFEQFVKPEGEHRIWTGPIGPKGYGVIAGELAHRAAWWLATGRRPVGHILNTCGVKLCVRHEHWRTARGRSRERKAAARETRPCKGCDRTFDVPVHSRRQFHSNACKATFHKGPTKAERLRLAEQLEQAARLLRDEQKREPSS